MKKWIVFSSLLSLLLLSSCSWKPEKEIITKAEVYVPTINVVSRPNPLTLRNADVIVITEKNLKEVIQRVKDMQGSFVVYALDPCLLYTSPSPRDKRQSRMPSSA